MATSFGKGPDSPKAMGLLMRVLEPVLKKPAQGASTSVFIATAEPDALEAGLYWSDTVPKDPVKAAIDVDAAARLWSSSARMVGLAD